MKNSLARTFFCIVLSLGGLGVLTQAQTTAFAYQGKLTEAGVPASGTYSMQFKLFDTLSSGTQIGSTVTDLNVVVTNGMFSVRLDFDSSPFSSADRYLEISVRKLPGDPFTTLSPRQQITSSPYAIQTIKAQQADFATSAEQANTANTALHANAATTAQQADMALDSQKLGGLAANQYLTTASAGSAFVRNTTTPQAADFNITGSGTVGGTFSAANVSGTIINAGNQFNIGGNRILSIIGTENLFAGMGAGQVNTGTGNAFFGAGAGESNTSGEANSFFGRSAGNLNTHGMFNSFFGDKAGLRNTTAGNNTFVGSQAGYSTDTGANNSFFGAGAGAANTSGTSNTFVGYGSGSSGNTGTSSFNTFVGMGSGIYNTGNNNTFFGYQVGMSHGSGSNNTLLGSGANVAASDLVYATALGAGALVNANNTVVLGRFSDAVKVPGSLSVSGSLTGGFVLDPINGGTGVNSAGLAGNFLRSDGFSWTSSRILGSDIPSGSNHYIQNTTDQQTANFNILGNGLIRGSLGLGTTASTPLHRLDVLGSVRVRTGGISDLIVETEGYSSDSSANLYLVMPNQRWVLGTKSVVGGNNPFDLRDASAGQSRLTIQADNGPITFPTGNMTIGGNVTVGGHVMQSPDKGGLVKAMLFSDGAGQILRCFNGVTGNSTPPCGFYIQILNSGWYSVNLGFPTAGRIILVSTKHEQLDPGYASFDELFGTNHLYVFTINSNTGERGLRSFSLAVF